MDYHDTNGTVTQVALERCRGGLVELLDEFHEGGDTTQDAPFATDPR
jgi:hypothetical protein